MWSNFCTEYVNWPCSGEKEKDSRVSGSEKAAPRKQWVENGPGPPRRRTGPARSELKAATDVLTRDGGRLPVGKGRSEALAVNNRKKRCVRSWVVKTRGIWMDRSAKDEGRNTAVCYNPASLSNQATRAATLRMDASLSLSRRSGRNLPSWGV